MLSTIGPSLLAGCASPDVRHVNTPLIATPLSNAALPVFAASAARDDAPTPGATSIIIALSGGGSRSAAFGYGVLTALANEASPGEANRTLADDIAAIAGVSGGGVLAAHVALHGREGLANFRRDFLDQDVEASLRTAYTPDNLLRAYRGGVNDQQNFPVWLDQQLFHGATLGDLARPDRPRLILHATDLYNRAPFAFDRASFAAICSSYDDFPLAQAVAASAAVPIAFAPISLRNFRESCPTVVDAAPVSARADQKKLLADSHIQQSIARYGEAPDLRYLKLLDGGLVDNLGARGVINRKEGTNIPAGFIMETAFLPIFGNMPQPSEEELLDEGEPIQVHVVVSRANRRVSELQRARRPERRVMYVRRRNAARA